MSKKKSRIPPPPRTVPAPKRRVQAPKRFEPTTAGFSTRAKWGAGAGALPLVVAIVLAVVLNRGPSAPPKPVDFATLAGLQTGTPPWENGGAYLQDRLAFLDLSALSQEGVALHIHEHLDVFVNGQKVTVPALIGITSSFITEVHTHDTSGIIHIESPKSRKFILGQFFGEWGVRLNASCLGRYCGQLKWWINGKRQVGNPALQVVKAHDEVVIAVGKPPTKIPASFTFPQGL